VFVRGHRECLDIGNQDADVMEPGATTGERAAIRRVRAQRLDEEQPRELTILSNIDLARAIPRKRLDRPDRDAASATDSTTRAT
jgi:hypothetical protein